MSVWAILSLGSVAALIALNACLLIRPPPHPGLAQAVRFGLASHLVFALGSFYTYVATTPADYEATVMLLYAGLLFVGPTWWLMSLRYAESIGRPFKFATPIWTRAPLAIAGVLLVALLSNPLHQQFFIAIQGARNVYGWLWWVNAAFAYGLVALAMGLYFRLAQRTAIASQRARIYSMMAASLIVLISSLSYVVLPLPLDPTPVALSLSGALYLAGIYQTGHFSLSRVAIGNILEQQPNGVLVSDLAGALIYWNPASQKILQTPVGPLPDAVEHWLSQQLQPIELRQSVVGAQAVGTAFDYQLRSNPERIISVRVENLLSANDNVRGHIYLLQDTTAQHQQEAERVKLQEQMAQKQKLEGLGILAGGIAHDFNNLLLAIRGNTELALHDLDAGRNPTERLRNLDEASLRATKLTHHLLTYAGKAPSKPANVKLAPLISKTAELLQTTVLHNNKRLQLEIADQLWVSGDEVQLEQVLMNLILNAAEASPASGVIEIRSGLSDMQPKDLAHCQHGSELPPGQYAWIDIEDRGHGIKAGNIDRMFDPFYSTKQEGHGLGLAAVLGIVRAHRGALRVSSNADLNRGPTGTRISVFLPAVPEQATNNSTSSIEPGGDRTGYVLVVDDEHIVRDVACRFLRNSGYLVLEANSGEQALALLSQLDRKIALAIVDVVMPGIDGPQTVQKLREFDPHLPAVFISGHPRGYLDNLLEPGSEADYLAKPFSKQDLLHKVSQHCAPHSEPGKTQSLTTGRLLH